MFRAIGKACSAKSAPRGKSKSVITSINRRQQSWLCGALPCRSCCCPASVVTPLIYSGCREVDVHRLIETDSEARLKRALARHFFKRLEHTLEAVRNVTKVRYAGPTHTI